MIAAALTVTTSVTTDRLTRPLSRRARLRAHRT